MKRLLLLSAILMVAAAVASAAPIQCFTANTLQDLVADGSCASQGLIFSGFSFTSLGSGSSHLLASQVAVSLTQVTPPGPFGDNWVFSVVPYFVGTNRVTTFMAGFDLSYTVSVASPNPAGVVSLIQSTDLLNTGSTANLDIATDTQTSLTPAQIITLITKGCATCGEASSSLYALTSFKTSTVVTIPTVGGRPVSTFEQDFASTVPEPVTFLLIGSGLIGLAFLRRRSPKS